MSYFNLSFFLFLYKCLFVMKNSRFVADKLEQFRTNNHIQIFINYYLN